MEGNIEYQCMFKFCGEYVIWKEKNQNQWISEYVLTLFPFCVVANEKLTMNDMHANATNISAV